MTREKKKSEEKKVKSSRVVVYEYNLIRSEIDKLIPYTGSSINAHVVGVNLLAHIHQIQPAYVCWISGPIV